MKPLTESDILYQNGKHWVVKVKNGFEINRNESCYAVRVGTVGKFSAPGFPPNEGFNRAKAACDRKESDRLEAK